MRCHSSTARLPHAETVHKNNVAQNLDPRQADLCQIFPVASKSRPEGYSM